METKTTTILQQRKFPHLIFYSISQTIFDFSFHFLFPQVDAINKHGQGLLQSAPPGVSTSLLEADLESLNNKWSDLNERVSKRVFITSHDKYKIVFEVYRLCFSKGFPGVYNYRWVNNTFIHFIINSQFQIVEQERKLDTALLQSGKFKDALVSLMDWLGETEEMVASQKAPSIDYKVVKAQVAEQKFLQRMLDDRAGSVTNMQEIGKDITDSGAQHARPDVHVQEQVTDLVSRWNKIQQSADDRNQALESTMLAAKEFHDQLEPFLEWLESAEKEAQAQEIISTEPDRIAIQISHQQRLSEDIQGHQPDLKCLLDTGKDLLKLSSGEDHENLSARLHNVADRYNDLAERSGEHLGKMEHALPMAERFHDTHDRLLDILCKVEPELRGAEPIGPEAEAQVNVSPYILLILVSLQKYGIYKMKKIH